MVVPQETIMEKYIVTVKEKEWRLDKFLMNKLPSWISRTMIQKAIKTGKILVNGQEKKTSYKVKNGDIIEVEVPKPQEYEILPEKIDLSIIYEDKDIIVLNKPSGMIVHPLPNKSSGTLVNALLEYCKDLQGIGGILRPGIVHRLDKDTSGVIVVAKNDLAHQSLSKQFKDRVTMKTYLAIVDGRVKNKEGMIDLPIARHPQIRIKMTITKNGKVAISNYKVLKYFGDIATLILVKPKTGRTHQIRVHFKAIGHPLLGDVVYGHGKKDYIFGAKRQMLHALSLGFFHPRNGKFMKFNAPLPEDFKHVIKELTETSQT